jgi:hypothetical protein
VRGGHIGDPSIEKRRSKYILKESGSGEVNWIEVAQHRIQWRYFVIEILNAWGLQWGTCKLETSVSHIAIREQPN